MSAPSLASTVGQLVVDRPARSRVFQHLGIDFCCGGKLTLEQAARRRNLEPNTVLAVLLAAEAAGPGEAAGPDPADLSLADLCDHIEQAHHAYLKTELPRLSAMIAKVARVHGARHPWMQQVHETFEPFAAEMVEHMAKEEEVLFPMVRAMEAGRTGAAQGAAGGCGGTVGNPIGAMVHEHDAAGVALARMRELTSDFAPPPDACNTFRATLDGLAELERDMHLHVHKENNILFPRALDLERRHAAPPAV